MVDDNGRDFWRCMAGSIFGFALALVWIIKGFGFFLLAAALTIVGGLLGWLFGRIFA